MDQSDEQLDATAPHRRTPVGLVARSLPETYGNLVADVASSYVGHKEVGGNNRGAFVAACLRWAGFSDPVPWCTSFAVRCLHEAAKALGLEVTCPTGKVAAAGAKLWQWVMRDQGLSRRGILILDPRDVRPGDILILGSNEASAKAIRRGSRRSGHTAVCIGPVTDQGWVPTVEGNTNSGGSRDGDGVYTRSRPWHNPRTVGAIRFNVRKAAS